MLQYPFREIIDEFRNILKLRLACIKVSVSVGFRNCQISLNFELLLCRQIETRVAESKKVIQSYSCSLLIFTEEIVYPTDAPVPKKKYVSGKIRLSKEKYLEEYGNKNSKQFKNMANRIETAVIA